MNYQYSPSNESIAICNPSTNELKIHKISGKECILNHTFLLSSNIFTHDEGDSSMDVKELHWMDENTIIVWTQKDKKKNHIYVYDLSLGGQIGTIQIDDNESILAIRSSNNDNSICIFTTLRKDESHYRISCKQYSKEGKLMEKVKVGETKNISKCCIGKTITTTSTTNSNNDNSSTVIMHDGSKIRICNIATGKSTHKIKTRAILEKDDGSIIDACLYDNNNMWICTNQGSVILFNINDDKINGSIVLDSEGESIQNIINSNHFILVSYPSKVALCHINNNTIKLLSTFTMKTTLNNQEQVEQCLLGGCVDNNHLHFCFYLMNMNSVRSERLCFLNENKDCILPSNVAIGEEVPVKDDMVVDVDGKPIVKEPGVLSLSQTGPKRSPEMNIIPSVNNNKRAKINDEEENDDDDDDDGLTIQQILQKQLIEQNEEYVAKENEEQALTTTTIPSTKSLSTILTQILTSYDEKTFHHTILNNTKPNKPILQQTLSSLEYKYIPIFLNKLTTSVQTNHTYMTKVLPWVREIIMFSCAYKQSIPRNVMKDIKNELLLWKNIAERSVRYYDDTVALHSRLDFMINMSKYRNETSTN